MLALFKRQPFASTAFVLASAVTIFFGVKMIADAIYWADPEHRNQIPTGWMTPGYVSHSWKVDNENLREYLDFNREAIKGRPTLRRIAETKGIPVDTLISELVVYLENHDD